MLLVAIHGQHRGPGLLPAAHPGVVVLTGGTVGGADQHPLPGVLVHLDPAAGHRGDVAYEVPPESEGVLLDLAHPDRLGVRVDGLLLAVIDQQVRCSAPSFPTGAAGAKRYPMGPSTSSGRDKAVTLGRWHEVMAG